MSMHGSRFLGLRTVCYRVGDMKKAKEWYSTMLGHGPYFDEPYYIGFNVGGYELGLMPAEGNAPTGAGGSETYWGVQDVQAAYDRLLSVGAKSVEAPHNVGGPIMVATISDPWGNVIGLIFNPGFSAGSSEPPH